MRDEYGTYKMNITWNLYIKDENEEIKVISQNNE